jgi:hypothetical protein
MNNTPICLPVPVYMHNPSVKELAGMLMAVAWHADAELVLGSG